MKKNFFCLFTIACALVACNHREFPMVKDLSGCSGTSFILTDQDTLRASKNNIYAVSFLYAWKEIKRKLDPLSIGSTYAELNRINNSTGFNNSLRNDEVETTVTMQDQSIDASAYFKKSLPFDIQLQRFSDPLAFGKEKVASFGFYGSDEKMRDISDVLYYRNDSSFVIRLKPKDVDHEIILYQPEKDSSMTFKEFLRAMNEKIAAGAKEKSGGTAAWKYEYKDEDIVQIPVLGFNIETNFRQLLGNKVSAKSREYIISKAYQRTAFILDEIGAEVESRAETAMEGSAMMPESEHPKHVIFNRPFLVVLKRKDSKEPYFIAWIQNTELMTKN